MRRAMRRWCVVGGGAVALVLGGAPRAHAQPGTPYLLVVTGASGGAPYADRFHAAAARLVDAVRRGGVPAANVLWLAETPTRDPRITARSGRAEVERAFADLATRVRAGDPVLVLLVGHGSAQGGDARFNIPGPDLTARDWARLVGTLKGARVAFVNAASASGDFLPALSATGRIVVTATKSGSERNETRFAEHFTAAYAGGGADVDKDGRVSLLEAYGYARRETEREYETQSRLLTEHAQLDDDGDGTGTAAPSATTGDGRLARAFVLGGAAVATSGAPAAADPALAKRKADLEQRLADLRGRKASMSAADYDTQLEALLVELARVNRAMRAPAGGTP
jgi:hypothetical protein